MLQALFLQHFNGFILHGTFHCCLSRNLHYIFEDSIFSFGVLLLFCCYSKCTARNRQYIRLKVAATKVFFCFFKVRTNCNPTKPYNKSLINLVYSVCTGKYCLRFLSHRPRSFVARSVYIYIYMLFTGWEVRTGKISSRGLRSGPRPKAEGRF